MPQIYAVLHAIEEAPEVVARIDWYAPDEPQITWYGHIITPEYADDSYTEGWNSCIKSVRWCANDEEALAAYAKGEF